MDPEKLRDLQVCLQAAKSGNITHDIQKREGKIEQVPSEQCDEECMAFDVLTQERQIQVKEVP